MKMTIVRKGIFIIFFRWFLTTHPIYAAPICPTTTDKHKVGFCGPNGTYSEWDCRECPPGLGLTVKCGTVYSKVHKVHCQECKDGTYSDKNDFGQCKPCSTPCQKNEVQIGECRSDRNTLQCKCKQGYYRASTASCMPCSWCCGDKTNVYEDACMGLEKQCSYQDAKPCDPPTTHTPALNFTTPTTGKWLSTTSSISNQIATTLNTIDASNDPKPSDNRKINEENNWSQDILIIAIVCPVVLIILLASILKHFCWKTNGTSSNYNSSPEVSSSNLTSSELNSSALLMPGDEVKEESATTKMTEKIQIKSKDTVAYKKGEEVPLVTAPANQGELEDPATGTDTGDDATESSAMMCTCMNTSNMLDDTENSTEEQLSKEQNLDLPVTKLPLKIYSKICTMLDVEDHFFNDYRMLAEELGVKVEEVKAYQKDQTNLLLTKYQPKVRKLIDIFTKKIQRADVVEILESWLNH